MYCGLWHRTVWYEHPIFSDKRSLHIRGRIGIYFENGSSRLFQNVGKFLPDHTASHHKDTILHTQCKSNVVSVYGIKSYRGSRGTAPLILNPCTRQRWAVSFKPRTFYAGETRLRCHWIGCCGSPTASLYVFLLRVETRTVSRQS